MMKCKKYSEMKGILTQKCTLEGTFGMSSCWWFYKYFDQFNMWIYFCYQFLIWQFFEISEKLDKILVNMYRADRMFFSYVLILHFVRMSSNLRILQEEVDSVIVFAFISSQSLISKTHI